MSNTTNIYMGFRAELLSLTDVTDIVDDRVYFGVVPRSGATPAITLNPTDGSRETFYRGSYGFQQLDMQIGVYSSNPPDLLTVFDAMNLHFNGFSANLNNDTNAAVALSTVQPFLIVPEEDGIHGITFDVELTFNGE